MTAACWLRYHRSRAVSTRGRADGRTAVVPRGVTAPGGRAARQLARGEGSTAIARDLRVGVRSVKRWRHSWAEGGPCSLRSQRPASLPRLSDQQFAQLEAESAKGCRAWPAGPALDVGPCGDGHRPALSSDVHDPGCAEAVGA
ncbi:helix-turn-helix domain-containing protein [Streptomyces sp. NBC_00654]|uniref:helix-turn-helix domain-containing protein n=1 Tax=Streptomyces sp. NBC_00654 TaxID=2975799 RepID=UPI002B1D8010|nr:helix-turn-helix domain-containing protein [Streptomyces sp. NBC_00654]